MATSDPVFATSCKQLVALQDGLSVGTRNDATQAEMERLADLVLSAAAPGISVKVRAVPGISYTLTAERASRDTLNRVATILAYVSNSFVSFRASDHAPLETCEPLGIPFHIAHAPSQCGPRLAIAHRLFEMLALPGVTEPDQEPTFSMSGSHREILTQMCGWRIEKRPSGIAELVIESDFTVLRNDEFVATLKELQIANPPWLVRFEPSFESMCLAAHQVFDAKVAWKLESEDKKLRLTVYKTSHFDERFVAEAARSLEARLGVAIDVRVVKPQGLALLPPAKGGAGEPASCTATKYLPLSISRKIPNSNIVTCTIPSETRDERDVRFISEHISPGGSFVEVVSNRPFSLLSGQEFVSALDELTDRLQLPRFYYRVSKGGGISIEVPSLADVDKPEALVTCLSYCNSLKQLCKAGVELQRNPSKAELFAFFSRTVGHDCEWNVEVRGDKATLYTPHPERFTEKVRRMARTVFDKQVVVVREPEELQGEYLLAPERAQAQVGKGQFFPTELELIFPRGFGNPPIVRQRGNRVIVYSMTRNLPREYKDAVASDFYGLGVPVLLRDDMRAGLVTDIEVLQDIVVRSLPPGTYLRHISESDDTFTLELTNCGGDRRQIRKILKEISKCCSKRLAGVSVKATPEFREVMSSLSSDLDKKFFALAIDGKNVVADSTRLQSLFLSLFDFRPEPPKNSQKVERLGDDTIRDLTDLLCFSVDLEETRIGEDAFSVEQLPGRGYRFGIHVIAGSRQIVHGSAADVRARRRGVSSIVEFDKHRYPFRLFAEPNRQLFNLAPRREVVTFSLMFETDARYSIKPDTYTLSLARIRNRDAISFSEAGSLLQGGSTRLNKRALAEALRHTQELVKALGSRSSSFADASAPVRPRDMTHALLAIFNTFAEQSLARSGVALPLAVRNSVGTEAVKFNGPVRSYYALLAQRQLEKFLLGKDPMSASEIDECLAQTGTAADRSNAYQLIIGAERLRKSSPGAAVVLRSQSNLGLLDESGTSESSIATPEQHVDGHTDDPQ
jgi:hypothetical protein